MLQLRKILLLDNLYIILLIIVIILLILRLSLPVKSEYTSSTNSLTGIVLKKVYKDEKLTLIVKQREKVLVSKYSKTDLNINLGDKIYIKGKFQIPPNNTSEYLFNYRKYLKHNNINYIVKARKITKLSDNKSIYYSIKQIIINHLGNEAYLNTFLLGDKSFIKTDIQNSFQENGISHLFAISGMHISLLATTIEKIVKKKLSEESTFKVTSLFLLFYLFIVGISPSILRGVLFYILFSINRIYYFYIKPKNLFLLILSISLLINPNNIFEIGFQFSYLISFSLISLSDKLSSNNYFYSLLKVSVAAFLVSIPICLYNFYQINIMSIFLNLFYVPFVSIILFPLSLIVIIIKPLLPLYELLVKILETSSLFFSKINIGKIIFKRLPLFIYLLYLLLIIVYLLYRNKWIFYCYFLLLFIHLFVTVINYGTYITFIDVGQGDSILIHKNNKNVLLDTGGNTNFPSSIYNNTTKPLLKSLGVIKIDYFILSHGDYDHMGEAINLVNSFKVEKVIFNCGEYNDLEKDLIKVLDKKKIKYYSCIKELNIDKNKLYFLQTIEYDNENDNSNVIYTELNGYKFMFMGDASSTTEKEILDKYNLPEIDVLKVGHHGSKTSSSKEFIDDIKPKYSIISVGKNNRYGHPNKEVLNTLEKTKIYRTDQDGSIMFKIKNNKIKIETCTP